MRVVSRIEAVYLTILRLTFLLAATIALVVAVVLAITAFVSVLARAPSPLTPGVPRLTLSDYVASHASPTPAKRATSPTRESSSTFDQFEKKSASQVCDDENAILAPMYAPNCRQVEISLAHQNFSSGADLQVYWNTIVPLWDAAKQSPTALPALGLTYSVSSGVGIAYSIDEKTKNILVENVIIGPSARAGIRGGDQITAINSQPIKEIIASAPLAVQEARIQRLLGGNPGTRVALTILRDGAVLPPIMITRAEIRISANSAAAVAHDQAAIDAFSRWATTQVQDAIAERQREDVDAQAAFAERKHQVGPALYAATVAGALFLFISFIFLAVKIERDVRTIAQQSREDRRE
jgi:hypothetical protein